MLSHYQQLLQVPLPQPPPALPERADLTEKPAPKADSTKSTLIGFTSLYNSLLIRKVTPFSLKVSSFSCGSSRAMPSAGPDHPPSFRVILTERGPSLPSINSLITSPAFSDTSNISCSLSRFVALANYSATLLKHMY